MKRILLHVLFCLPFFVNAQSTKLNNAQISLSGPVILANGDTLATNSVARGSGGVNDTSSLSNRIGTNTAAIAAINTQFQAETKAYLANVIAAGGKIGAKTLYDLDNFIARGKSMGWYQLGKELWIPIGDFAASKVKLISTTTWTFNNFVASDYSEETGYQITGNSTKYIGTVFIPDNQGLSSKNISIGYASVGETTPTSFGRILGTATGTGDAIYISNGESNIGIGSATIQHSFGHQTTATVGTWGTSSYLGFLNGTYQQTQTSLTSAMAEEINIFRSMRGNGMQYANGSLGLLFIGSQLTQAQAQDMNLAIMDLMRVTRNVWKKTPWIFFGDSITAGTGSSSAQEQWVPIFSIKTGQRSQNNAQGSSKVSTVASGIQSAVGRYSPLVTMPSAGVAIVYGTNDEAAATDAAANGTASLADTYYNNLSTVTSGFVGGGHKVIIGTPPYATAINDIKSKLYAVRVAKIASVLNIPFVDLYHAFLDGAAAPSTLLADGVHPNAVGHRLMADYMYEAYLGRMIRKPTFDYPSIAGGASYDTTVIMYNAMEGMTVTVTPPPTFTPGIIFTPFIGKVGTPMTLTGLVGGTGGTNGTYTAQALTGGTGTGATATITVAGGIVTAVTLTTNSAAVGYTSGDVLSASITGLTGFTITVDKVGHAVTLRATNVTASPIDLPSGQFVERAFTNL